MVVSDKDMFSTDFQIASADQNMRRRSSEQETKQERANIAENITMGDD